MPTLKVCGNMHAEDLSLIKQYQDQIDYAGFIFTPKSKRYVTAEQVSCWTKDDPTLREKAVAVFMNQSLEDIKQVIRTTGIKRIQLHGNEHPDFCAAVKNRGAYVWKTIHIENGRMAPYQSYLEIVDGILLDTKVKDACGGTGVTFDWDVIPEVKDQTAPKKIPLMVAGGITEANVSVLLEKAAINGIDVASGVESFRRKDAEKVSKLLQALRNE